MCVAAVTLATVPAHTVKHINMPTLFYSVGMHEKPAYWFRKALLNHRHIQSSHSVQEQRIHVNVPVLGTAGISKQPYLLSICYLCKKSDTHDATSI
jgi:hypothetical protein